MTAAQIKSAVALLGFNPELSDDEEHARFWTTLNMVLPMIAIHAPISRTISIAHFPTIPSFHLDEVEKSNRAEVIVDVPSAAALYFEVIGTGRVELSRGGFTHEETWERVNTYRPMRFFMKEVLGGEGDVKVRFFGDYAYTVRHLCGFDTLMSDDPEALLPPRRWVRYDLRELCADFDEFVPDAPFSDDERTTWKRRVVSSHEIEISADQRGVLDIYYRARPRAADEDHEDEEIDLDPSLHHLVPLLVAHYLWMDDEPSKAAQYKANYDEQLALYLAKARPAKNPCVINVNGW